MDNTTEAAPPTQDATTLFGEDGLRVIGLHVENFKRITLLDITPPDDLVVISGKNGSGKTSAIDAVFLCIAGGNDLPDKPIRDGQDRAEVTVNLGALVVKRVFTASGQRLYITTAAGTALASPQAILDQLKGDLTFDPLEFLRLKAKEQVDRLLALCPLEVDLPALADERARLYEQRTQVNRDAERARAAVAAYANVPDAQPQPVDVVALLAQRREREGQRAQNDARRRELEEAQRTHYRLTQDAEDAQDTVVRLREQLAHAEAQVTALEQEVRDSATLVATWQAEISALQDPTFDDLDEQMARSEEVNLLAHRFHEKQLRRREHLDLTATATSLNGQIKEIDQRKAEALSHAVLPLPGLAFDETGVVYEGIPLEQCATSEQLRVSIAIAMAANPTLRIIRISDGSLLDSNNMDVLREMTQGRRFQAWVERVDESGEVGLVIEEGQVVKVN